MPRNYFRPAHETHAIVEQLIYFEFTPTLEAAMPALITLKDDLHDDFPVHEIVNTMRVQLTQHEGGKPEIGTPEVNQAGGLRLSRLQPNGAPDMLISIDMNSIGIFCHNYSTWEDVWPKQRRYIDKIFAKLTVFSPFLTGIGMKWTDQFLYDGPEKEYDSRDLFKENSKCLNPLSFSSGQRWHCHTGWFDGEIAPGYEVLNQLNVDAGLINLQGNMRIAATIDHNQVMRAGQTVDQLSAFAPGGASTSGSLPALMEALHDGNKRVLRDLLTESALEMIALRPEQAG